MKLDHGEFLFVIASSKNIRLQRFRAQSATIKLKNGNDHKRLRKIKHAGLHTLLDDTATTINNNNKELQTCLKSYEVVHNDQK